MNPIASAKRKTVFFVLWLACKEKYFHVISMKLFKFIVYILLDYGFIIELNDVLMNFHWKQQIRKFDSLFFHLARILPCLDFKKLD